MQHKYTHRGFINLDARNSEGLIIFDISDSGIGIADNQLDKIFNSFYQIEIGI